MNERRTQRLLYPPPTKSSKLHVTVNVHNLPDAITRGGAAGARRHSGLVLRNGGAPRRRRFQRRSGTVLFKWRCGGGVVGGICGHVAIAASSCENRTFKHRSGSRRGSDTKQQHRRRRRSWFRSRCSELPMAPKVSQQGGHSGEGGREGGHEGGSHWCQRGAT